MAKRITQVLDARGLSVRRGDGVAWPGAYKNNVDRTINYGIVKDMYFADDEGERVEIYVERRMSVSNHGTDLTTKLVRLPIKKIMRIPVLEDEVLKDEREGRR